MGLDIVVPAKAEVISAVGDALSLVRAERERTLERRERRRPSSNSWRKSKREALAAGAAASSLDVRVEHLPNAVPCALSSRARSR